MFTGEESEEVLREEKEKAKDEHDNTVRHAIWIYDPNAMDWGIGGWRCSRCAYVNDTLGSSRRTNIPIHMIAGARYCACCGARMDGRGSENKERLDNE